jgi:hypothetical protein
MNDHATNVTMIVLLLILASALVAGVVWCGILINQNSELRIELARKKIQREREREKMLNAEQAKQFKTLVKAVRVKPHEATQGIK